MIDEVSARSIEVCNQCASFHRIVQIYAWCKCLEEDSPYLSPGMYENSAPPDECPFLTEHKIFELNRFQKKSLESGKA